MKRLLSILSCLLIATVAVVAQKQQPNSSAHFGVKGGICFADQKTTSHSSVDSWSLDTQYRRGIDAGVYVEIPIIKPEFAGSLEIHYIQKGSKYNPLLNYTAEDFNGGTWDQIYEMDYLSIPVLFKWRIPVGRITPYALIGPSVNVFLRKQVKNELSLPDANSSKKNSQGYFSNQKIRKLNVGATAGLGIEALLKGDFSVLLEFRYDHSFANAIKSASPTIRNRSFQLLAGIRIPMKGIGVKVNAEKDGESF